ncbi:MAG: PHP domain-containing protein [Dehalococcoidales bacterium]|nr:PHP domain-containing protein [Dehalococcoidales bacterium]
MIIDLHTHTKPWSDDSLLRPAELIQRSKEAGLDAICFTDHDWFWKKDAIAKLSREHDFLILPGAEVNTEDGHFLVFGIEKYRFGMWRTEHLRRMVDEVGGVMILAHPFRRHLYSTDDFEDAVEDYLREPILRLPDAIEVLNGKATDRQNKFSLELLQRLNLRGIGGSDAHSVAEIPSCATIFERKISNIAELIAEIKAGRFKATDLRPGHT